MTEASSSKKASIKDIQDTLRLATREALERKRKLGQYSVVWQNNKIIIQGDDAPSETKSS